MKPIGIKQIFNSVSIVVVALLGLCQVQLAFAQLNTFEAGQPIRASEMNHNFEVVQEQIEEISSSITDAGCSATQEGSNVRITCADGSEGLLASGGTIVLLPESSTGEVPDVTINSGEIVVVDANGVVIGRPYSTQYFQGSYLVNFFPSGRTRLGVIYNDDEAQSVNVGCYSCSTYIYYEENDCSGIPFVGENTSYVSRLPDGKLYVAPQQGGVSGQFLFGSRLSPPSGECLSGEWATTGNLLVEFIPAPEILNAAYPVRLEQLP